MANGEFELPIGTLKFKPVANIEGMDENGIFPRKVLTEVKEIDDNKVTHLVAIDSRSKFSIIFPDSAVEIWIHSISVKVDDPVLVQPMTLTWELIKHRKQLYYIQKEILSFD